ncbi:putative ABC transport system permease protein [Catalinimonas alkaloidigena]|uniref:Putative ABC transport system permease protein n=1 Tax=Catalinimonas alkaloidigena TaxID=1075417 RepID=A0A1G9FC62_9BACT|nr:ABC transporter permease [Catalinimonas alkaloidigena]SDK85984.1 putative ABC transport system permease protein [Catalinimonas alkaloidigena]
MARNYLLIAWRNLKKNKVFSLINVLGLAVGIAACLLILQYVSFEWSFDRFYPNAERIYRVVNDRYQQGELVQHGTITYSPVGPALAEELDAVEAYTRLFPLGEGVVRRNEALQTVPEILMVDEHFLPFFSYSLLAGDPATALVEPNTCVLTETWAATLFGKAQTPDQLLNQLLVLENEEEPLRITGIMPDLPENAHLPFDLLISFSSNPAFSAEGTNAWRWSDFYQYVRLKPGTEPGSLQAPLEAFSERHFHGDEVSGSVEKFYLQPLLQAHLHSDFEYEIGVVGNGTMVWGLLVIALLILVIAWVNYVNLTTARSLERAREVGIRKVIGAQRQQLIGQFLAEALLTNLLAFCLAVTLVQALQSPFNQLLDRALSLGLLLGGGYGGLVTPFVLLATLVVGSVASGFYPAFVLSATAPVLVLKGRFTASARGSFLQKALVVGQFAASVLLIAGSCTVYQQMQYMQRQELGLRLDQVLVIPGPRFEAFDSTFIDRVNHFKDALRRQPSILAAASSQRAPGDRMARTFNARVAGADESVKFTLSNMGIDHDYQELYGVKQMAGRSFQASDYHPDFNQLHVAQLNRAAVRLLGFASPQAALGQKIVVFDKEWDVVGVVDDFHQQSLHHPIEPLVLFPMLSTGSPISIKVQAQGLPQTLASIEALHAEFFPGNPFDYTFLDESFARQYRNDRVFGQVFQLFTGLAIFVACLGLFGLVSVTLVQRTKEIGVRKVLGASLGQLVLLLSQDFVRLILLANLLALPLAYFLIRRWLQEYAFHVGINGWLFGLPLLFILLIAGLAISGQTLRAASANPVDSLRSE